MPPLIASARLANPLAGLPPDYLGGKRKAGIWPALASGHQGVSPRLMQTACPGKHGTGHTRTYTLRQLAHFPSPLSLATSPGCAHASPKQILQPKRRQAGNNPACLLNTLRLTVLQRAFSAGRTASYGRACSAHKASLRTTPEIPGVSMQLSHATAGLPKLVRTMGYTAVNISRSSPESSLSRSSMISRRSCNLPTPLM